MHDDAWKRRRELETLDRRALQAHQLARLNQLLEAILPHNNLYAEKLRGQRLPVRSLDELRAWPLTSKDELFQADSPWPRNLTWPLSAYVRFHQTSGTRGRPLAVLDTAQDWQNWLAAWQYVLDAAELSPGERAVLAFSFGPFIGFWTAFDALVQRGCMAIPSGGMSTSARLELLERTRAQVLLCTPSYALRLAEVAAEQGRDLRALAVRKIIVAGEPGGSLPATRARIENAFGARVIDHAGATEVGPWGYADAAGTGLFVTESEFIAEFLEPQTGEWLPPPWEAGGATGQPCEMVLTNLFRAGCPALRFRTGDIVRPYCDGREGKQFVFLEGGVVGRADDMLIVRGVNVFPSAIEQIVRSLPEAGEFRVTFYRERALDQVRVEVEATAEQARRLAEEFRARLGLSVQVECVRAGTLPRSEGKAHRIVDLRGRERT